MSDEGGKDLIPMFSKAAPAHPEALSLPLSGVVLLPGRVGGCFWVGEERAGRGDQQAEKGFSIEISSNALV